MVKNGDGEELKILEKCFLGQDTTKVDYAKDFDVEKSRRLDICKKQKETKTLKKVPPPIVPLKSMNHESKN